MYDMKNDTLAHVLDAKPFELTPDVKAPIFYKNVLEELKHHYDNNELYKKFCIKKNFNPYLFVGELSDLPYIPVHIFKALGHKLASVADKEIKIKLQSSATSGVPSTVLLDKITARRQVKAMARVMQTVLGSLRRPFCVMDLDPTGSNAANLGARSAAIKGYLNFSSTASYFIDSESANAPLEFLKEKFVAYLNQVKADEPMIIFGFTFVLYHTVFRQLKEEGITFSLPKDTKVIHIGGWKKLESEKVNKSQFNNDIASVLGIDAKNIIDVYGFTEQMGLNYPDCPHGWKHIHAYADVIIRNEKDLSLCNDGEQGLLEFISPLPHSYPGNVVLTDDLGVLESGPCECGQQGKRFRVIGRAKKAEVRGCGDIMSEKVSAAMVKGNQLEPVEHNLIVHHAPAPLKSQDALAQLDEIIDELSLSKKWLCEQPTEAIIGLLDLARRTWSSHPSLDAYRNNGLNFLISWCEPNRIRTLLDTALNGRRSHLDGFQVRSDIPGSSLRALPRGIVVHWLSGNVPLLGMFALLQSIVTKNVNILKVSADESQALPALLGCFKGLTYTTPGGYTILGDDLLKTMAVIYFDRNQHEIANKFSSCADVRIAWGGREAVEAVSLLPKKYTCQDILFGPKLSMMVVGNDALDTDKAIRKLIRRAATDASVFDQFACASPHTIFVEKGGVISPQEFAKRLSLAMDKALVRLPTSVPDTGQANKIRSKIAEYDFIGEVWSDNLLRWTVLFEEDTQLVSPTYFRVITVKAVDNIFDVIPQVHEDIQTVGLAMRGDKRLKFANAITMQGAMRCPDIGHMTHFDSPWDGLYAIDRMIRWVSLGGPL
ncbi:acyl-CoA reductase [Gammaproteobacteria bacterium 42_54_T18]|nr:acyl-CoA reductase [Gammaproteobacteria bacterium 42_54_T18]